jgi:hypothetical protein
VWARAIVLGLALAGCGRLQFALGPNPGDDPDANPLASDGASALGCPAGYIPVSPRPEVGTEQMFCVAKYEMQDVAGVATSAPGNVPWGSTNQVDARARCAALGTGYALLTNPEWMTIARDIEAVAANWQDGVIGSVLNRGHSDNDPPNSLAPSSDDDPCAGTGSTCSPSQWDLQRRTHVLGNGHVLWDFAGNLREYIDWNVVTDKASPVAAWRELNTATPTVAMPANSFKSADESLLSDRGVGGYYPGSEGTGGAASRGGFWSDGSRSGVFNLFTPNGPTASGMGTGFRCAFHPDAT